MDQATKVKYCLVIVLHWPRCLTFQEYFALCSSWRFLVVLNLISVYVSLSPVVTSALRLLDNRKIAYRLPTSSDDVILTYVTA